MDGVLELMSQHLHVVRRPGPERNPVHEEHFTLIAVWVSVSREFVASIEVSRDTAAKVGMKNGKSRVAVHTRVPHIAKCLQ